MVFKQAIAILQRTSMLFVLMFFMFGCASYHQRIAQYYQQVGNDELEAAQKSLAGIKLLQKPRNKILYAMEQGRIAHLKGDYALSNRYFNQADLAIEDQIKNVGDFAVGLFLNSMSQNYQAEEFEIFMLHYYKALNYIYLGQPQEALVEARRISLQNYQQGDKYNQKTSRYSEDAFSYNLQGLIYEYAQEYNDAFIAYRNAIDTYKKSPTGEYYGVSMPLQLQKDVIRMAAYLGFSDDQASYEKEFNLRYEPIPEGTKQIVLFWENGRVAVKEQEDILFTLVKGEHGALFFTNALGIMIPVDFGISGATSLNDLHSLHIAFPRYVLSEPRFTSASVITQQYESFYFELVEDIDALAVMTLKERSAKEMGRILTRLAVKKAAEYSVKAAARNSGKDGSNDALLQGIGLGIQLFNAFSEKADTRNWQTLPAQINYVRLNVDQMKKDVIIELHTKQGNKIQRSIPTLSQQSLSLINFATIQ